MHSDHLPSRIQDRFTQTSDVTRLFRMWVGCPEDDHTSKELEYHPYSALQILAEM